MNKLKEVAEFIKQNDCFLIVSHYDADGLAAAGIIGKALEKLGKQFSFHITKSLAQNFISDFKNKSESFIFTDLGSGAVSSLEENLAGKKFAVIDHHTPEKKGNFPHFNAHYEGIDGNYDVSGSGMAYLVAKELDKSNAKLASIAIVGAVGDMQHTRGGLKGVNRKILEEGIEAGVLEEKKDILLYGRYNRPLIQFLSYSMQPYLPGLTAEDEACRAFIMSLGIEIYENGRWKTYSDLSEDEKKRFVSGIFVYAKKNGVSDFSLKSLVGEVYELKQEKEELKDAKEFSTMLNACGRNERGELGVRVCMGDRDEYLKKARVLLQKHRENLRNGIEWAKANKAVEMSNISVLDSGKEIKDTIIGTIAGMLYGAGEINKEKPIIAVSEDEEGMLKVSGRATPGLVRKGVHLGNAFKKLAEEFGGAGGGHNIAAGAHVEIKFKKQYLKKFNEEIGNQLLD